MQRVRQPAYRVGARTWAIVTLYRDAGASVREVSQILDLSLTTVWYRLRLCGVTLRVEVAPTSLLKRQPYAELHRKSLAREIVCGRKYCPGCGRWRLLCDFPPDTRKSKPRRFGLPAARCRACGSIGMRYYEHHATQEQIEARREYQRIYKEAQRRAAGIPVSTAKRRRVTDHKERVFLDPAPLVREIERACQGEYGQLARVSGVSERAIYRLRTGESAHVRIDNADRLALGLGLTLEMIYQGADSIRFNIHTGEFYECPLDTL
jgi:hypothetical protein